MTTTQLVSRTLILGGLAVMLISHTQRHKLHIQYPEAWATACLKRENWQVRHTGSNYVVTFKDGDMWGEPYVSLEEAEQAITNRLHRFQAKIAHEAAVKTWPIVTNTYGR